MKESGNMKRGDKRRDLFDIKRIAHYDRDGRKTAEDRQTINPAGLKKIEHYDRNGHKTGESRETTAGFGFKKIEHFDRDGHKTGETREKID